tara:strand:- start:1032 stop:1433 length:402 start_codon:yes stop_codon:yes gene_type:complete
MDKSTLLKGFNNLFFEFLDDVLTVYPDNKEIKYAKNSFNLMRKANPIILIRAWYNRVYTPYKDQIDAGDITFFFEKDYNTDLNKVQGSEEIMKMIDKIRQPLKDMGEENLKHSSMYIQKLSKISFLYKDFLPR